MNNELRQQARLYQEELVQRLFGPEAFTPNKVVGIDNSSSLLTAIPPGSNIVGFGYGTKHISGGEIGSNLAVRVYVRTKLPLSELSAKEIIPSRINGIATDVIVIGDIRAFSRPIACGVSIGHFSVTAGTLGCLVRKTNGIPGEFILSNSHVLANENIASIGDPILEPGKLDGGRNPIAKLTDFEPLNFGGGRNVIDAAIAEILNPGEVTPDIKEIGRVNNYSMDTNWGQSVVQYGSNKYAISRANNSPMDATWGQSVKKYGRSTYFTQGIVDGLYEYLPVKYTNNKFANMEGQIIIRSQSSRPFSNQGDSGSLVLDALSNRPIGLLVAGDPTNNITVVNPIVPILQRFQIEII